MACSLHEKGQESNVGNALDGSCGSSRLGGADGRHGLRGCLCGFGPADILFAGAEALPESRG